MDANVEIRNFWWFIKKGKYFKLCMFGRQNAVDACDLKPYRQGDFLILPNSNHLSSVYDIDEENGDLKPVCKEKNILIIGKQLLWEHWPEKWYLWRRDIKLVFDNNQVSFLEFDHEFSTLSFKLGKLLCNKKYHCFEKEIWDDGVFVVKELIYFKCEITMVIVKVKECGIDEDECPYWVDLDGKRNRASEI